MEDGGNFLEHMSFFRRERNACIFGFLEAFPEGRNFSNESSGCSEVGASISHLAVFTAARFFQNFLMLAASCDARAARE